MNRLFLCVSSTTFLLCCLPLAQAFVPSTCTLSKNPVPERRLTTTTTTTTRLQGSAIDDDSSSSFDMNELRQRINQEYASYVPIEGAYSSSMTTKERRKQPDKVHVVVFQAGTINQGAHTIEYPKGSGNNVVMAFESIDACRKFAASLQAQNFVDPTPRQYRLDSLQNFFSTLGVFVQVVPEGVELKPPSQNVPKFGHNPSLCQTKKYLDYLFEMTTDDDEEEEEGGDIVWSSESRIKSVFRTAGAWE